MGADDGRAGGGDELEVEAAVVGGEAGETLDRRGRGEREATVAGVDEAAAHGERRDDEIGADVLEGGGAADDVDDGVDGADLVEVDVVDGHAVHLRFRAGEPLEGGKGAGEDWFGELGGAEQLADLAPGALRLGGVDVDVEVGRDDAALHLGAEVEVEAGQRKTRGGLRRRRRRGPRGPPARR